MTTHLIPLWLAAAHMVGDYIAQNDWMAAHKLSDWRVRLVHVTCYTACFAPIVFALTDLSVSSGLWMLAVIFVTHFITDCRRWASGEKWPPKPILVDQTIHIVSLAAIGTAFGL